MTDNTEQTGKHIRTQPMIDIYLPEDEILVATDHADITSALTKNCRAAGFFYDSEKIIKIHNKAIADAAANHAAKQIVDFLAKRDFWISADDKKVLVALVEKRG